MFIDFIKAMIVGMAASMPIGPIAIFVIQKTISKGFKSGFVTSLGSTIVDTLFAIIAVFALAYVQDFIQGNYIPIFIGGGLVIMALGLSMAFANPFRKARPEDGAMEDDQKVHNDTVSLKDFASAIVMGLTNPGAIAVMFALMAFFGIGESQGKDWSILPVILGIACGSAFYWAGVTFLLNKCRKRFKISTVVWINRITGGIVVLLGIGTLIEGIIKICINL